eukprot:scaffold262997_cov26-Prasinocladus_malaysianus.AAC.1
MPRHRLSIDSAPWASNQRHKTAPQSYIMVVPGTTITFLSINGESERNTRLDSQSQEGTSFEAVKKCQAVYGRNSAAEGPCNNSTPQIMSMLCQTSISLEYGPQMDKFSNCMH